MWYTLPVPDIPTNTFLIILLLPCIPLLIFSLSAALPEPSVLPFNLNEVYITAGMISVAGAVVLCMTVWPDVGIQIAGYARYGTGYRYASDIRGAGGGGMTMDAMDETTAYRSRPYRSGSRVAGMRQHHQGQGQMQWEAETRHAGSRAGERVWTMVQDGPAGRQEQVVVDHLGGSGLTSRQSRPHVRIAHVPPTQAGRAALRRETVRLTFPRLYKPYTPPLLPSILLMLVFIVILVFSSAHILKAIYAIEDASASTSSFHRDRTKGGDKARDEKGREKDAADPSKMTPWVMAEIKHRQSEKDDPAKTLARVAKDAEKAKIKLKGVQEKVEQKEYEAYRDKKAKERAGEIEVLRVQLEKLGLPLVGIPDKQPKPTDTGASEAESSSDEATFAPAPQRWGKWLTSFTSPKKTKPKEKKPPVPVKDQLKKFFFLDAYDVGKKSAQSAQEAKMDLELYKAEVKAKAKAEAEAAELARQNQDKGKEGQGWEMADPAMVSAAVQGSAANAERLARQMEAEKG